MLNSRLDAMVSPLLEWRRNLKTQWHGKSLAKQIAGSLSGRADRRVRVAFLMVENQKWSSQSIYEALAADPVFEPVVLASTHVANANDSRQIRTTLADNLAFATAKGLNAQAAFDQNTGRFIALQQFAPDVVFYEQPYGLPVEHQPRTVGQFALTCYVPYGYGIYLAKNSGQKKTRGFSEYIWRTFLETREFLRDADQLALLNTAGAAATGYPKMDAYVRALATMRRDVSDHRASPQVVYAPHHSVVAGHPDSYGTFAWSGRWLLAYAQQNPQIRWIFKPHPKLKESLVASGAMSLTEAEAYFSAWDGLSNTRSIYDGEYLDAFVESDAMITDSGSFLLEYLLTGQPMLLLKSASSAGYSDYGNRIAQALYQAGDVEQIQSFLSQVVSAGNDPRKPERVALMPALTPTAGQAVVKCLKSALQLS